jgi:hypothetical protein
MGAHKHALSESEQATPANIKKQKTATELAAETLNAESSASYPFGSQPVNSQLLEKEKLGFVDNMKLHHFINVKAAELFDKVMVYRSPLIKTDIRLLKTCE